ncbi:flavin reductase family protein [Paenirhodobacter sp.]|uniref:flavin reductase family protein n=1 Tax=Paenirhodobacter sp. TaxID=1965326 RepID=UPI003B3D4E2E
MRESQDITGAVEAAEHHAGPVPLDPRALRDALGQFATGVTIVTTRTAEGQPVGLTANSFASVSLDPPLVLWSAARASMRHQHFAAAQQFAIHVLGAEQEELARHFTRNGMDFTGIGWQPGAGGVPLLDGVLARFDCVTEATHEGGDHTIIIGRVTRFMQDPQSRPLLFCAGRFVRIAP